MFNKGGIKLCLFLMVVAMKGIGMAMKFTTVVIIFYCCPEVHNK